MKDSTASNLKFLLIALILAFVVRNFLFNITFVNGSSMEPTLSNHNVMFSLIPKKYFVSRGDIVVVKPPTEKNKKYIKRLIGLPNEEIKITNGKIYIDDQLYEEDYISNEYTEAINATDVKLKDNEYFIVGDNRNPGASSDSRLFGPISRKDIKSVVVFKIYPFN
ncbi:signal peptidase I [Anaerosphaera aminiphila DSM 21120]|uniref:Signal peptidase I n=1 Tax=Anaerosphaera aminiphila DSM 21120 TaxID=1120995 RepID=A0A1M5RL11_9FIRM|nr:signal peptidase I [Anaerosphaera aminiphila]SHH26880.1 signal peptidase I [Anaerosphaera aminiphila DSM 21120]